MKRFLLAAIAVIGITFGAQAQTTSGDFSNGTAPKYWTSLDTVTNAGTKTYTQTVSNHRNTVSFQVNMTKITGTTSAVTVAFQGSVDGTNYVTLHTDTMADASTIKSHVYTGNGYVSYKIVVTGSGTQSSSYRAYMVLR